MVAALGDVSEKVLIDFGKFFQRIGGSLRNAAGKRDWSRAAAWSCESLCASSVIRPEPVKFKVLDAESFGQYLQQYAVINAV